MFNPCYEHCYLKYGRQYTEECDNSCEYANSLSKLKPYGGIDEVVKIMKCNNCYLRYHCDEQTEFICKNNDYCKYMPERGD